MRRRNTAQNRAIQANKIKKIDHLTILEKMAKKRAENGGKIDLIEYLLMKEQELQRLNKEVSFLQSIQVPLMICGKTFYSEDYSLATDFEIKKRDGPCNQYGASDYDGGTHYYVNDFYAQFYFKIKDGKKSVPVYVQHKGFDEDEKIVFRRIKGCRGSGIYSDRTKSESEYIDVKKVFSYLENKGVKKRLINKLEKKIEEIQIF